MCIGEKNHVVQFIHVFLALAVLIYYMVNTFSFAMHASHFVSLLV
jgi:hypothetical protein